MKIDDKQFVTECNTHLIEGTLDSR